MKFSRKDQKTGKSGYIILMIIGLGIIYGGYTQLSWGWNLGVIPIGLLISLSGYKNFRKSHFQISSIDFLTDSVLISYMNGESKSVKNDKIIFAILVKRYHQPVRRLTLWEKGKIGSLNKKTLGELSVQKWPNLEDVAKHLVQNTFSRNKWRFGWTIGDMFMLFSLILGMTENTAESYIGKINSGIPNDLRELGDIIDDETDRKRDSHGQAEEDFIKKSKDSKRNR